MTRRPCSKGFRGTILSDNLPSVRWVLCRKGIMNMTGERAADWFA